MLYDAYYDELEAYANHQQRYASSGGTIAPPPVPVPSPVVSTSIASLPLRLNRPTLRTRLRPRPVKIPKRPPKATLTLTAHPAPIILITIITITVPLPLPDEVNVRRLIPMMNTIRKNPKANMMTRRSMMMTVGDQVYCEVIRS